MAYDASLTYSLIKNERCIMRKDFKDITGLRSGRLVAVEPRSRSKNRGIEWLCKCDCGEETWVYGGHLRDGHRKSCGCLAEKHIEKSGVNSIMIGYKQKAKKKNIKFELSFKEFWKLIKGNCTYCGKEPSQILHRNKDNQQTRRDGPRKIQIIYNGIDKVNPTLGYISENCVSCCKFCNQAKSTMTIDEFKNHIKRIYKWLMIDF